MPVSRLIRSANGSWKPGPAANLLGVDQASGRDAAIVNAERLGGGDIAYRLVDVPAAFRPVGGADAHAERLIGRPGGPHRADNLEREAHSVFERTAIFVGAMVRKWREELVQQIAMGRVDLDQIEAGAQRPPGRGDEGRDDAVHVGTGGGARRMPVREGDGRGGHCLPCAFGGLQGTAAVPGRSGRGLTAGMSELDAHRHWQDRFDDADGAGEGLLGFVGIKSGAAGGDSADRLDTGGLDHHETRTRRSHAAEMGDMPTLRYAVDRAVLAHGRDHDTIGQRQTAHGDRFEQGDGTGHSGLRLC